MGWKIIFAQQALEELEQIVRFIAQDDPQASIRFGNYLVERPAAESGPTQVSVGIWIVDITNIDSAQQTFTGDIAIVLR